MRPGALWRRMLATFIDGLILLGIVVAYLVVASSAAGVQVQLVGVTPLDWMVNLMQAWSKILVPAGILALVLGAVYAAVFAMLLGGRTPGRLVTGLRLVDPRGRAPGPLRAIVRAVLAVFSFVFLLAGFWLALIDRRGQTLHDKLTHTFVVQPR